ncbi:MAG: caspase family protein [Nitrospirae bacterium]|nr:MAG: caspase family protein [Nitrospirota bacterium]
MKVGRLTEAQIRLLITKEQTTKAYIKKTLEAYRGLNPEDVFVFYVASHGTVDEGEYFLITSNVGSVSTFRLKKDALTQAELKELIASVPSTKKLIVIDTCNAGKLGEALQVAMLTRGMSEETAVKILSRAVGSTIISASTSLQEALEGYQGHGLFTYVLAEGLKGRADTDRDGFIKTLELATYVDSEVPTLAEKLFNRGQYPVVNPSGQAFPVGKVK